MKHGFIKVAAATPKIKVADVSFNTKAIIPPSMNGSRTLQIVFTIFHNSSKLFNPQYENIPINIKIIHSFL